MSVRQDISTLCLILACSALAGCGNDWQVGTHPATGRVTINGEPPVGALVQLFPTAETKTDERKSRPWGLVGNDGGFSLSTYVAGDGAPAGEYAFTITWPPDASKPSMTDRLKFKYSKPEGSKWTFTIKPGTNALPPVEIENAVVELAPKSKSNAPMEGAAILGGTAKGTKKAH
ncbi:hypothetical protein [Singulisphaera sp. PoT]|uniref:hypothetical protein n=1 Tax=Singulisphaera sp. PoT TaxID=3411797 RepID=UPI003BF58944